MLLSSFVVSSMSQELTCWPVLCHWQFWKWNGVVLKFHDLLAGKLPQSSLDCLGDRLDA